MVVQTVLSRCLGKVKQWPEVLGAQAKMGYNAIHMVPIQKYGISGSLYSLKDQNSIDDWYVEDPTMSSEDRIELVKNTISEIRDKHSLLCFIDIVLNHTAVNSDWLSEYPDAAYNLHNCPFLRVAWEFDRFLVKFSESYAQKNIPECPAAPYIASEGDLRAVIAALATRIKTLPLEQYFMYGKEKIKAKFEEFLKTAETLSLNELKAAKVDIVDYILKHSFGYGEKHNGVDLDIDKVGAIILAKSTKAKGNKAELWKELNGYLDKCNERWKIKYEGFMREALGNIEGAIRYEKITMKNTKITADNLIVKRYFTEVKARPDAPNKDAYIMAHNGWTMVTEDFASPMTFHYLRRLVVIWDDSIKLYYGAKREDSPYIWSHMEKYVGSMASIFQGIRIDNCHSTPLHVLEYFVNYARSINPNLFVFAELFSGDAGVDAMYAKRIGLNALIRESIYTNDAGQLADRIKTTAGDHEHPLGDIVKQHYLPDGRKVNVLHSCKPKALLYDITHDNPAPVEQWNPLAILPLACALGMANESIGTTRGVDELLPKNLSVISEKRCYSVPPDIEGPKIEDEKAARVADSNTNVEITYNGDANRVCVLGSFNGWKIDANVLENVGHRTWKTTLNLPPGKYQYKFVLNGKDWVLGSGPTENDGSGHLNNVITVGGGEEKRGMSSGKEMLIYENIRAARKVTNELHAMLGQHKTSLRTYAVEDVVVVQRILEDVGIDKETAYVLIARTSFKKGNGLEPENVSRTIVLPGKLSRVLLTCNLFVEMEKIGRFGQDGKCVNGVKGQLYYHLGSSGLKHFARVRSDKEFDTLEFFKMPSSFCLIVTTTLSQRQAKILNDLKNIENPPVEDLCMGAINHLLFRCSTEEQEFTKGARSIYEFKGIVPKYAGIAGLMYEFNRCKSNPNSCIPIFDNIKEGNWLIDYHLKRISEIPELKKVYDWLLKYLAPIKEITPSFKPKWFVCVISKLFYSVWGQILKDAPTKNDMFSATLMLSAYQFMGNLPTSAYRNFKETLSAGLPHFAVQYMRCWGRDTMISLRGLLLIPQRYKEARDILLMFAAVSRHGFIPNLHDQGNNTRFNARDATWFFMEALQEYVKHDKEHGASIFKENIQMQFLDSNQAEHYRKVNSGQKLVLSFADVIQNLMQSHAKGIDFVEWNAGTKIDAQMTGEGFHQKAWLDLNTGFVHGGNKFNCGTWMDKMGSSEKAKNKGVPATPRDGADVEIVGLLRSAVRFLEQANKQGIYPYEGVDVNDGKGGKLTYKQWGELIDANFEKFFWIPSETAEWAEHSINHKLVQQTGIYKDVVGCSDPASEYRFRPNFAIAMAVAPEMFKKEHAQYALNRVEAELFVTISL